MLYKFALNYMHVSTYLMNEDVEEGKDKTVEPLAGLLNVEKSLL